MLQNLSPKVIHRLTNEPKLKPKITNPNISSSSIYPHPSLPATRKRKEKRNLLVIMYSHTRMLKKKDPTNKPTESSKKL